jgi:hypothetical protein
MDEENNYNNVDISIENRNMADLAVFSFIKIIAKLNKYEHIISYNNDPMMK